MHETISVCVVVLTAGGRPEWLRRCLLSVRAAGAREPALEVRARVAVNGPDPESETVAASAWPEAEVLRLERRLPGAARNAACRGIEASWVFFIDDDAYVSEEFLSSFVKALGEDPDAHVIGGPNLTPPGSTLFQRATGVALASRFATFVTVARYRPQGEPRPCGEESLILCNLFVRREALGPAAFPERLVCAEENSFLHSLRRRGGRIVYRPELGVWHERRTGWSELSRQVFKYGRGRAQSMKLDFTSIRAAYLLPSLCVLAGAALPLARLGRLPAATGWWVPFPVYGVLTANAAFASGIRSGERWVVRAVASLLFPLIHVAYGLGVLCGLLGGG